MTQLTILTGTTRGLGAVMAAQLAQSGEHLVTLSRVASEALAATAKTHGTTLTQINVDLGDTKALEQAAAHALPGLTEAAEVLGAGEHDAAALENEHDNHAVDGAVDEAREHGAL